MADHTSTTNLSANPTLNDTDNPTGIQPENSIPNHTPNRRQLLSGASALALSGVALSGVALSPQALPGTLPEAVLPGLGGEGAVPSLPVAPGLPPGGIDPAYVLYVKVKRAEGDVNAFCGDTAHNAEDDRKYKSIFKAYLAAEHKLAETPATSLMGVYSKLRRLASDQEWEPDDPWLASWMGHSILYDLRRMIKATPSGWPNLPVEGDVS